MKNILYVDGAKSQFGQTIAVADKDENILLTKSFSKKNYTNVEMEYKAIIEGFKLAESGDIIRSDSQLCVNQINGLYNIKENHLKKYADKAIKLKKEKRLNIEWISRKENPAGHYLQKKLNANVKQKRSRAAALRRINGQ